MSLRTEKQVMRAVKAMDKAREALVPFLKGETDANDSVLRLRADLAEYADYLENATWWRKEEKP